MIDFQKLKVDRVGGKYSAGKAPHKAVLLLTIIKLYENRNINLKEISFKNIHLLETYKDIWKVLDYDKPGPISNPLFHLKNDGFYNLHFKVETPVKPGASLKRLLAQAETAGFNDEFIAMAADDQSRKKAVQDILTGGYFTTKEISNLIEQLNLIEKSFEYEKIIQSKIKTAFEPEHFNMNNENADYEIIRKGSFRRMVLDAYNATCAVCRSSLIVADTSILDAAHILPFAKFANDDPRNGLALCKNHHWLFDNGGISISPDYRIRISKDIAVETPEGLLSQYARKRILLPDDERYYPAKEALEWHNQRWNFRIYSS